MHCRQPYKMYNVKEMFYVSTQRKAYTKIVIYTTVLSSLMITITPYFLNFQTAPPMPLQMKFSTDLKYILLWKPTEKTQRHREPKFAIGQTLFIKQKCQFINCYITYNRDLLKYDNYFDAIVFDIHDIRKSSVQDYNFTRAPYQKYIFRSMDSAETHAVCKPFYEDFFNWTWTYRLDSDIPHPFLDIYDVNNTLIGPTTNMSWVENMVHVEKYANKIRRKRKAIAWLIESCKLKEKHKEYIATLKKEMDSYNYTIHTYGSCGEHKCPEGALYKCYKLIEKEYYFQLVFEDSIAEDYVTEKLVKVLQLAIIPIVYGGANYQRFLPPGTYINAQAFDIKKLGAIINYLITKADTYSYFLDWKNHYSYTIRPRNYVCDLCTKLNNVNNTISESKQEFRKWWNSDFEDICTREKLYYKFVKDSSELKI